MTKVLVIGAGHNGLVAGAYLAKSGLSVSILESRPIIGGCSVTEEVFPGLQASTCAFTVGLLRPEVIADLALSDHGLSLYLSTDDTLTWTTDGAGRSFAMYADVDRTAAEIHRIGGTTDRDGFVRFGADMQLVGDLLVPTLLAPPPTPEEFVQIFEEARAQDHYSRFIVGPVRDVVEQYFEDPLLRGHFAYPGVVSIYGGPSTPGSAYVLAHHSVGEFNGRFGQWGWARGGMGSVADALASAARSHGATIETGSPVESILVERGRAVGAVTADGTEHRADVVVSNADPQRTLLGLVGAEHLPASAVEALERFDVRGSMARVFLETDTLPDYSGGSGTSPGPAHVGHTFLGPDLERFERAWETQRRGEIPDDPTLEVVIEAVRDPQLANGSSFVITTGIQQLPFELAGRTWDDARDELTRVTVDTITRYAPNLSGRILATRALTPLDLERDYGVTGGNIFHGAMGLDQMFGLRPFPEAAGYHTPVRDLYLCSAGTHPGGGVMGACGYNAAMAVLTDRGLPTPRPWQRRRGGAIRSRASRTLSRSLRNRRIQRLVAGAASSPTLRPLTRAVMRRRTR